MIARYAGYFIESDEIQDALIELHEIGPARGDTDEEIAEACFAMLKAKGCRPVLSSHGETVH